jgi:hypothetical protein
MLMGPPNFKLPPGSTEARTLLRMWERRREIIDAALRGGHPYHLAKKWSLEEVPQAEMDRVQLKFDKAVADAKASQNEPMRPWWWPW